MMIYKFLLLFIHFFFFFNDPATTEIYTRKDTLSLHDALPIYCQNIILRAKRCCLRLFGIVRSEEHTSELQSPFLISYAVFCLKKKNKIINNSLSYYDFFKLYMKKKKKN